MKTTASKQMPKGLVAVDRLRPGQIAPVDTSAGMAGGAPLTQLHALVGAVLDDLCQTLEKGTPGQRRNAAELRQMRKEGGPC